MATFFSLQIYSPTTLHLEYNLMHFLFVVHGVHRFGYSNFEQRKWRQQHSSCGGNMQSPIRIDTFRAIPLRMPAVEMVRYHDYLPGPLELRNNGHSGNVDSNLMKNMLCVHNERVLSSCMRL